MFSSIRSTLWIVLRLNNCKMVFEKKERDLFFLDVDQWWITCQQDWHDWSMKVIVKLGRLKSAVMSFFVVISCNVSKVMSQMTKKIEKIHYYNGDVDCHSLVKALGVKVCGYLVRGMYDSLLKYQCVCFEYVERRADFKIVSKFLRHPLWYDMKKIISFWIQ